MPCSFRGWEAEAPTPRPTEWLPAHRWVMLKNVHLAPGWLMQLEKKLHSLQPHACFRLFLTMEINPKVRTRGGCGTQNVCLRSV